MAPHTGACDVRRDDDARSMAGGGVSINDHRDICPGRQSASVCASVLVGFDDVNCRAL
jgi:hypothetical protein